MKKNPNIVLLVLILWVVTGCGGKGSDDASTGATASTSMLGASSSSVTYGTSVILTATVTPSAATGTVTFNDGSISIGSGTLSSGVATLTTDSLSVGEHTLTATYGGSGTYSSSTSGSVTVTVLSSSSGTYSYTDTTDSSSDATENCAAFAAANQVAHFELTDASVSNSCPTLLLSSANSNWGTSGSNGGATTFKACAETLTGNVIADNVSTADIYLYSSTRAASQLTGAINNADSGSTTVALTLDSASQWVVTATLSKAVLPAMFM